MNAHQLDSNGKIINTIVVDDLEVFPNLVDASIGGSIGDSIIDGAVVKAPVIVPVPHTVTRSQAIQALFLAGITGAAVEAAIESHLTSPQKDLALIRWKESTDFERNDSLVVSLGTVLGLSSTDIDNLFITAASL